MRSCYLCGKSYMGGGTRRKLRGKYNPTNWTKKKANLQRADLAGKRVLVCARCLKTLTKNKSSK